MHTFIFFAASLILAGLKMFGFISCSWWVVLLPAIVLILSFVVAIILSIRDYELQEKKEISEIDGEDYF